mgnify:CR=1 FL=1
MNQLDDPDQVTAAQELGANLLRQLATQDALVQVAIRESQPANCPSSPVGSAHSSQLTELTYLRRSTQLHTNLCWNEAGGNPPLGNAQPPLP